MIEAERFLASAKAAGFDFWTGVPCSFLTPFINRVLGDSALRYVGAASEGEAVAVAAGAWLAGRRTVVMCQNSGLGNAVNPLTSLNHPFRIPSLLIVTWRGGPGVRDEPQHALMGTITPALLEVMRIPHLPFPAASAAVEGTLARALAHLEQARLPFALVLEQGVVREEPLAAEPPAPRRPGRVHDWRRRGGALPSRASLLEAVLEAAPPEAGIIATTGKCGRELYTLADRPQHLYQVGSMGCASGMGLGVALESARPVIVLDGDGAALMKLGTLATIGAYAAPRLVHVVLDNGVHDSTGGQPTVSPSVDFAAVAAACGYAEGFRCDDIEGFRRALAAALDRPGPHLLHARIAPGSLPKLGRPGVPPDEVALRFRSFLAAGPPTP